MRIRYVSNAGVVLETERMSIGIDCFCKDENRIYYDTPDEVKEQLLDDIGSEKLKALIFTHEHSDHFCVEDVKDACERNANVKVLAGKNVVKRLKEVSVPDEQLLEVSVLQKKELGEFQVQFIETVHEGEQYADIQNLSLLINIGRKTMVVTGDAQPSQELFQQIGNWAKEIDWLLAPFPYVGLRSVRGLIRRYLDVRNILVLHRPRVEKDTQCWMKKAKKVCEQAKDGLPEPVFSETLGEYYYL